MSDAGTRVPLGDHGSSGGPLIGALVIAGTGPPHDEMALRFSLEITNTGDRSVVLTNPYEGVTVEVTDGEGRPRALPAPARAAKTGRWDRALEAREQYIRLVGFRVDGGESPPEQWHAEVVHLPAGAAVTMDLAVERMRSAPGAQEAVSVTAGIYTVQVLVPLRWHVGSEATQATLRNDPPTPVEAT